MVFDWLLLAPNSRSCSRSSHRRGSHCVSQKRGYFLLKAVAPKTCTRRHCRCHCCCCQPQRPLWRVRAPEFRCGVHELDFGITSYVRIGSDPDDPTQHDLSRFPIRNHNQLARGYSGRQSDDGALRKYNDGAGIFRKYFNPFRLTRIGFDASRSPYANRNLKDTDRDRSRFRVCLRCFR